MNLYQFFNHYLERQILSKFPDFNVSELSLYYNEPLMYYYPKFLKIKKGNVTINDMMKLIAYCLIQNVYYATASFNFHRKYNELCYILNDFDPNYISILNPTTLFQMFEPHIEYMYYGYTPSQDQQILGFFENLISAANYLIKNFKDFNSYIDYLNNHPNESYKELLTIKGFGPYIANKYLNYIGCHHHFNIHPRVIELFKIFDNSVKNEKSFLISLDKHASLCGVSSFTLYKTVELIVRPIYEIHSIHIHSTRGKGNIFNNIKTALTNAINNKEITL